MIQSNKQREKPGITPKQLAAMLGRDPKGVICSGAQIENFRRGWAKAIFSDSKRAHFFTRSRFNIAYAESLCGHTVAVRSLYGRGNWPDCQNCKRIMKLHRISPPEAA